MRARLLLLLVLLLPVVLLGVPSAYAGVPDPTRCQVDPCLIVCPNGDFTFHVTVRDVGNNPVPGASVVINLCNCPGVHLCSGACDVLKVADAAGNATFQIKAGGICTAAAVTADGVLLAVRVVASPDQDGDLAVTAADIGIVGAKVGSADPTADFDCDGSVTPADTAIATSHGGHTCDGPVLTEARSWGSLKAIYR